MDFKPYLLAGVILGSGMAQPAAAVPERLWLECGLIPTGTGARIIGHHLSFPGAVAVYHNSIYEEQTTVQYKWSCSAPIDNAPTIGLQADKEPVRFPIDMTGSNQGTVVIKGRGEVRFVNIVTQTFIQPMSSAECPCKLYYDVLGTSLSLGGLQHLKIDAEQQGSDLQKKLIFYKLQKKVLGYLQESRERLVEIRANLNLNDPFEFVLSQKIDEILSGQDVGVTPATMAAALRDVKTQLFRLQYSRDLLANALQYAETELRQQIQEALKALNELIEGAVQQLRS